MRVEVERDDMVAAAGKALGMVARNSTIPILEHLLLTAEEGGLTLCGANADMQTRAEISADVGERGAATVSAARLHDLLRNLPSGGRVQVQADPGGLRVTLKCGRSRSQLPSLKPADYPVFDLEQAEHRTTLAAADLARLLDRTAFAVCREETRYYITGVHLHVVEDDGRVRLRAAATDGARLARADADCPAGWAGAPGLTIPRKAVGEIRGLIDGVAGEVQIWTNGRLLGVEVPGARLATKLIAVPYPDYQRVIPPPSNHVAVLDVEDFAAALKRCTIMVRNDKARMVKMGLEPGRISLRSRDGEGGEVDDQVEVDYAGPALDLSFNATLLAEIVGQMRGETFRFEATSTRDPVCLIDPTDGDCLFVCMPLRAG